MLAYLLSLLAPLALLLVGASGIETALFQPSYDLFTKVAMSLLFLPLVLLGLIFAVPAVINLRDYMGGADRQIKEAFSHTESRDRLSPLRSFLLNFREHYAAFFARSQIRENEDIQHEASQIYRSVLELRKKRLQKMDITLETTIKSMRYSRPDGLSSRSFSDGKYDITEVEEEIAARTIYRKGSKPIHTRFDRDLACYTIAHAKQADENRVFCPHCGAEAALDDLLDGCDHCGTTFLIEDLQQRVTEFAFRPDYQAAKARYNAHRNGVLLKLGVGIVLAMCLAVLIYLLIQLPTLMAEEGFGFILAITSALFAAVIGVAAIIPLLLFLFPAVLPAVAGLIGGIDLISKTVLKKLTESRKNDSSFGAYIRQFDSHFSVASFYSGLQNKISTVIYADTPAQAEAFAASDLSALSGRYASVINVETEYLGITDYRMEDDLQHMSVQASLSLTEYDGKKVRKRNECWQIKLIKAASCTTQVLCAPVVMSCQKCGAPLDLLSGKTCAFCGNELDMKQHDWVFEDIRLVDSL